MVVSREEAPLKIATYNINNINKRLQNLVAWLERAEPDVVCLQELKAERKSFLNVRFAAWGIDLSGWANVPGTV